MTRPLPPELAAEIAGREQREESVLRTRTELELRRWGPRDTPACFEALAEWQGWRALAVTSRADPGLPCIDCTREYQRDMAAAGRCANRQYAIEEPDENQEDEGGTGA